MKTYPMFMFVVFLLLSFFPNFALTKSFTEQKHTAKVILLGIDGVSLNILKPYVEKGLTPNLAKLMAKGANGHLDSYWPTRTPQVWTSAVTGKLPGQHGVWDHLSNTYFNPPPFKSKKPRVVTVKDRRSKALWNILDQHQLKSLVVGWMVTWPAESLKHGVIVAPKELLKNKRQTTIKGSFYSDADNMVQPQQLEKEVKKLIVDPENVSDQDIAAYIDLPKLSSPLYKLPYLKRYMYTFKWSHARAQSVEKITLALAQKTKPEVILSYFQCSDTIGHRFWIFKESLSAIREQLNTHKISTQYVEEMKKRFGHAFQACYQDIDQRVGKILDALAGPDTLVMIVSDHGFGHAEKPHPFPSEPYGGVHLDQGIIMAVGSMIAPNSNLQNASILDITPTLLYYLDIPIGKDMRGKVRQDLFSSEFNKDKKVKIIESYEVKPQLNCPYSEGYPKRITPPRPTAAQMKD